MANAPIVPQLEPSARVRRILVPPQARALCTLARIDYEDAFVVHRGGAPRRTAEQWARAAVEDVPASVAEMLQSGWSALGLKLGGAPPERSVLGWRIRRSTPEFVLLGADSRLAMAGELLFQRQPQTLLFCTFLQQDDQTARDMWARIEPAHVRIVPYLLERAAVAVGRSRTGSRRRPHLPGGPANTPGSRAPHASQRPSSFRP